MKTALRLRSFGQVSILPLCLVLTIALTGVVSAQDGDGDGDFIAIGQPIAGIDVDAGGVLKIKQFDPRLAKQRFKAARAAAAGGQDIMQPSELRKVSLRKLEAAIADRLAAGESVDADMFAMAGLTTIEYVFYYPESNDIVVAGPAEGYFADPTDRYIGIETGKPTLLLEDVVTAMRAFQPGARNGGQVISVSIDPTPEGLQALQRFLAYASRNAGRGDASRIANGIKQNLGLQTVTFKGIPDTTHFARVLVEADYRMKLVGIGLERLPVRMMSYVERANPKTIAANALERWYFQPNYDGIAVSEDGHAMRIKERGVQLVGANERVVGGQRQRSGRGNRASQAFCQDFTEKFNDIAARVRVYAELRQLIDVAIAAAYIQDQDFYTQAGWQARTLMDESQVQVETHHAPEQVETAVNAIWKGNTLMTPLGGGVQMQPRLALQKDRLDIDQTGQTSDVMVRASNGLDSDQWWWD
ncbi:MAG: DUF1598 domain-containing protein [Planctomycetota bacterium]